MKLHKFLCFIFILFLITGCKVQELSSDNYYKNIQTILKSNIKYSNQDAVGYQYYLPSGISVLDVNDFNQTLYTNGNKYYLYADVVSFYHKVNSNYKVDKNAYISKKIKYKKNQGYLEVNRDSNKYYVEMMYNFAKIEAYVKKDDLSDTITNMSYILSSVKYNTNVIETLVGNQKYDLSDSEIYNIFNTKKGSSEDQFLKYVNEYDIYSGAEDLIEAKEIEADNDK